MPLNLAVTDELAEELGPKPAGGPAANPQSVLEALRRRREQLANSQTNDFAVPGYEALDIEGLDEPAALIARYRRLSVEEYNRALFGNRDGTIIERNAQLLIDALGNDDRVGLFWRIGDADPVPLMPGDQAGWHDAAAMLVDSAELGDDVSAAGMVLAVFGGDEHALTDHAEQVGEWIQNGHRDADRRFLGGP
jgi:hypothetical protein